MAKRDRLTPDLFRDWQPPQVAAQLAGPRPQGGTLRSRISRAVGPTASIRAPHRVVANSSPAVSRAIRASNRAPRGGVDPPPTQTRAAASARAPMSRSTRTMASPSIVSRTPVFAGA